MCATVWRHLVKATEVTAGLAESNGSLPPPGGWLKKSPACTPGSAPGPTFRNEYGKTLPFFIISPGKKQWKDSLRFFVLASFGLRMLRLAETLQF